MSISRLTLIAAAFALSGSLAAPAMARTHHHRHAISTSHVQKAATTDAMKPMTAPVLNGSPASTPASPTASMTAKPALPGTTAVPSLKPAAVVPSASKL